MIKLTGEYLLNVIREEAGISGANLSKVVGMVSAPGLMNVRHRIWHRVHIETGAVAREIAETWGCGASTVGDGIRAQAHAWEALNARLEARHGPERAASIIAGRDPASNADRASWKALGRRPGAAA